MSGSSVVPCKYTQAAYYTCGISIDYYVLTDDIIYVEVMLVVLGRSGWREIRLRLQRYK